VTTLVTSDVLEALRRYDTPTLSNAVESFDRRPRDAGFASLEIRCMFPDLPPLVGFAATATIRSRGPARERNLSALYEHVEAVPPPRVVVVQDLDQPPAHGALWGEVQCNIFKRLDCGGAVTDGCVRDLAEVRQLEFCLFARGPCVSHAYVGVEATGVEVEVGGLRVQPHDLVHADQHGVLLIPTDIAAELPAAADALLAREQALIGWVRSPEFSARRIAEMRSGRQ
jgi:4-hydroxy-4-methyl-2-oxoglutarate aldolase